jgi:hypothetical protein
MTKITSQNQIEKQFLAEMGTELDDISSLDNLKLSESVSKAVNEKIPHTKPSKKKNNKKKNTSIFAEISDQIYGLISAKNNKDIILPSISIQKKRVKKSLEKEKSKLISKANKIRKARKFSSYALEEIISQIRYFQQLIDEMINFAAKKVTELYKKYYLKAV